MNTSDHEAIFDAILAKIDAGVQITGDDMDLLTHPDMIVWMGRLARKGRSIPLDILLLVGTRTWSLVHGMNWWGHCFTADELMQFSRAGCPFMYRLVGGLFKERGQPAPGDAVRILKASPHFTDRDVFEMMNCGGLVSIDEIIHLQNPVGDHQISLGDWNERNGHPLTGDESIRLFETGLPLSHGDVVRLAVSRYPFSLALLVLLGNPDNGYGWTVAHELCKRGVCFSLEELLSLGNPPDNIHVTPAHVMARMGHRFTLDELVRLGNPAIAGDALLQVSEEHQESVSDMEWMYKNNLLIAHKGGTIAHIMAREGCRFTPLEIERLGDPKDQDGKSIADWMPDMDDPAQKHTCRGLWRYGFK